MNKNRRKTMSTHSSNQSEYEAFKIHEYLQRARRDSITSVDELNSTGYSNSQQMLFSTLLTDPEKRAKVLELLTREGLVPPNENAPLNGQLSAKKKANRMNILTRENAVSPLNKVKKKFRLESPSAKLRKRELQQLCAEETRAARNSEDESELAEKRLPPDQILNGIVAYCEVRSGEEDRSELIKRAVQAMGAEVLDRLNSRSITHVVFRDGSYRTYERARLLGAKLVSVLWIEACRRTGRRIPEDRYPALGARAPDYNLTDVCGRLQDSRRHTLHINSQCELDSCSIISLSEESNISEQSGLVPPSQDSNNQISNLSCANITNDYSPKRSSDLGTHIRDSFELKQAKHIRSPESIAARQKRYSSEAEEDSIALHVSDDSKSRSSGVPNDSTTDQFQIQPNRERLSKQSHERLSNNVMASIADNITRKRSNSLEKQVRNSLVLKRSVRIRSSEDQSRNSLEEVESLKLHVISDNSRSQSSTNRTADPVIVTAEITSDLSKSNEELLLDKSKPKRRRLFNPTTYDLEDKNFRWSQAPKPVELPKTKIKYQVEIPAGLKTPKNLSRKAKKYLCQKTSKSTSTSDNQSSTENNKKQDTKISSESGGKPKKVDVNAVNERRKSLRNVRTSLYNASKSGSSSEEKDKNTSVNGSSNTSSYGKDSKTTTNISEKPLEQKKKEVAQATRKSLRNVKSKLCNSSEKDPKSNSSDEYFSAKKNPQPIKKSSESDKKEIVNKRRSIRQKLYHSPDSISPKNGKITFKEKPFKAPSRRSARISSIINSPPVKTLTNETSEKKINKAISTPSKSIRTQITSKTPVKKDVKKMNKPTSTPSKSIRTQITSKTPSKEDIKKLNDDNIETNVSRLIDKMISKEVSERRSTFEFEDLQSASRSKRPSPKYGTIVCTRLHREQTEVFIAIVRSLGKFTSHEDEVSKQTTHLIAGDVGRTVNMLRAIARGCWILRHEWLLRSAEAERWLPEEEYELTAFSPAVKLSRTEREVFGIHHRMDVLSGKSVWITPGSSPRRSDLQELVYLAGGKVAAAPRKADLILGEHMPSPAPICVAETWLLECITSYKCLPYDPYLLHGPDSK